MINRHWFIGFLLVIYLLGYSSVAMGQASLGKIHCICIDAGHGGKDPGAISGRLKEKDITLAIALKLGRLIKDAYPDLKVVYTRTRDVAVELRERGKMANRAKAQLFISIHVNKFSTSSVRGVETYVLGLHKSEASFQVAMKENEAIHYEEDYSVKYDGFDPKKAESYIMFNFLKNSHLKNSMEFAAPMQRELVTRNQMVDREVRQAGFIVLMDVGMPAVLIETGFISNPYDQKILTSESGQTNVARAVCVAFQTYKNKVERNSVVLKGEPGENERMVEDEKMIVVEEKEEVKATEEKNEVVENDDQDQVVPVSEERGDLFYAVQVVSSKTRIKNFRFLKLKDKVEELEDGGRYCYYVRKTLTYTKALEVQRKTRKIVKDGFLIAVYNGKRITVAEARKIEQKNK